MPLGLTTYETWKELFRDRQTTETLFGCCPILQQWRKNYPLNQLGMNNRTFSETREWSYLVSVSRRENAELCALARVFIGNLINHVNAFNRSTFFAGPDGYILEALGDDTGLWVTNIHNSLVWRDRHRIKKHACAVTSSLQKRLPSVMVGIHSEHFLNSQTMICCPVQGHNGNVVGTIGILLPDDEANSQTLKMAITTAREMGQAILTGKCSEFSGLGLHYSPISFLEHSIYGVDKDGKLRLAVGPALEQIGVDREAAIGRPLWQVLYGRKFNPDGSYTSPGIETLETGQEFRNREFPYTAPNGKKFVFLVNTYRQVDENGVQGALTIFSDLTQYKELEARFSREKALRREANRVFDSLFDAIITLDSEGRISYFNQPAQKLFGRHHSDVYGRSYEETIIKGGDMKLPGLLIETLRTGREHRDREVVINIKGAKKIVVLNTFVLRDSDGGIIGVTGVLKDITQDKYLEEQIQLSDKLTIVGRMAAGMAHEIRNPLTSIRGFLQLLRKDLTDSYDKIEYLDIMLEEILHITDITSEMLFLAKPEQTRWENYSISRLLDELFVLIESETLLKNIQLVRSYEPDLPSTLINVSGMKQVFINIVNNAIQAMGSGGTLTIRTEVEPNLIRLFFSDTGPGISPEQATRIFEPFYTNKEEGTGLGLTTAYRIIQDHGGQIRVESTVGQGTTFIIEIPVRAVVEQPHDAPRPS